MKEYKQEKALAIYMPLFQCMLNATGRSDNALLLKGEAISEQEHDEKLFTNTTIMSYQMQLAYYFDDMELAKKLSSKLQEVSKSFNAHYLFVARVFFFGMIELRLAFDATGRRRKRHIGTARLVIREMEQWAGSGCLNCLHKLLILKAELAALSYLSDGSRWCDDKHYDFAYVRERYDHAIATSTRSGFHNDAAVASERALAFCRRDSKDGYRYADIYSAQAVDSYEKWGCVAKVRQLSAASGQSIVFDLASMAKDGSRFERRATAEEGNLSQVGHDSATSSRASILFSDGALLASAVEGL